jgi:UDP-N-acetylglucosamine acyltransferase
MSGKLRAIEKATSNLRREFLDKLVAVINLGRISADSKLWHPHVQIHPTAVVHPEASLDEDVCIGPFCYVGKDVVLGTGCKLLSHVSISSNTVIGDHSVIHPFASVGGDPQDLKYKPEMHEHSWLLLGPNNIVREHASINRGTAGGGGTTSSGRACLFMSSTHVTQSRPPSHARTPLLQMRPQIRCARLPSAGAAALLPRPAHATPPTPAPAPPPQVGHDCTLGDNVVLSTGAGLAGHVAVGDDAVIGGQAGVRQRVRVGRGAMVGGKSAVLADVLPYTLVAGNPARCEGLNLVGLRRRGASRDEIRGLAAWLHLAHAAPGPDTPPLEERVRRARAAGLGAPAAGGEHPRAAHVRAFLEGPLPCGLCRPAQAPAPPGPARDAPPA